MALVQSLSNVRRRESPTPIEDTIAIRCTLALDIAAMMAMVPLSTTDGSPRRLPIHDSTMSQPLIESASNATSRSFKSILRFSLASALIFDGSRAIATTVWPCSTARRVTCAPTPPVAPITAIRMGAHDGSSAVATAARASRSDVICAPVPAVEFTEE